MVAFLEQENVTQHKISIPPTKLFAASMTSLHERENSTIFSRIRVVELCRLALRWHIDYKTLFVQQVYLRQLALKSIYLCVTIAMNSRMSLHLETRVNKHRSRPSPNVSNAWLLSYDRSTNENTRVLVRKNLWKEVLNEEIPVNKYRKKINHMSMLKEMMLIILKH